MHRGQLNHLSDDEIFQMLIQCGLSRAMPSPPIIIMATDGQPIQIQPPQSVDWCRYCGARASETFNKGTRTRILYLHTKILTHSFAYMCDFMIGPWGPRKLCRSHYIAWHRQGILDLSSYVSEPVTPINPYVNTGNHFGSVPPSSLTPISANVKRTHDTCCMFVEKRYLLHYLKRANVTSSSSSSSLSSSASSPYPPLPPSHESPPVVATTATSASDTTTTPATIATEHYNANPSLSTMVTSAPLAAKSTDAITSPPVVPTQASL
jgi:hypothetical protein